MTSAHPNTPAADNQKAAELILMADEELLEGGDFLLGGRIQGEPDQDYPGVRPSALEDQIAEIFVVGDEDSLLAVGDGENVGIGESGRTLPCDSRRVVTLVIQEGRDAGFDILIEEKPQTWLG